MITQLFKFKNFEKNFRLFLPFSLACFFTFLGLAVVAILQSPDDYQQGNAVKMMYVHVPAAWLSLQTYMIMAVTGFIALVWKIKIMEIASIQCAPIGAFFNIWGEVFNSEQILDYKVDSNHEILMFVNGEINQDFENYVMLDNDVIEIHYQNK